MAEQGKKITRPRRWSPVAREVLIECGLLEFLPDDYRLPEDIWTGHRPPVHRGHLKTIEQLSLIQEWFGLTPEQWGDPSFRACIATRYASGDRNVRDLLVPPIRHALKSIARSLARSRHHNGLSQGELFVLLKEKGINDFYLESPCHHALVDEYVRLHMTKNPHTQSWLDAPLSEGGLFRAVVDRELYFSSYKRSMLMSPTLWRYLQARDGTFDAVVGQMVRDLMEVENWNRRQRPPGLPPGMIAVLSKWQSVPKLMFNEDYYAVANRYKEKLEIPFSCFLRIEVAFAALVVEEINREWPVTRQSVFLAAALLEQKDSLLFKYYRSVLRGIRAQVKKWDVPQSETHIPSAIQEAEKRSLRSTLAADPLLRILLHAQVLEGAKQLKPKKRVGSQPKRAKRVTAAVADRILHPFKEELESKEVQSMYSGMPRARRAALLEGVRGSSHYQHVATLLNILFNNLGQRFTAHQIQTTREELGNTKLVRTLSENPGPALVARLET